MEFHSGALLETHNLAGYQSLNQDRGLTLHYTSTWADPREIIHFGYTNVGSSFIDVRMTSSAKVIGDGFEYVLPGYEQGLGGLSNVHFFDIPPNKDEARGALLADLVDFPTGRYRFEVTSFISRPTGQVTGSAATMFDHIIVVNETESSFGAGWTLGGQQKLIEHFDGSVVLIDGDGSELLYTTETRFGELQNPPGDYSKLDRLGGGMYRRTMPDQTVYSFVPAQRKFRGSLLDSIRDRNGNVTAYEYDANDNLTLIRDPVGLETTFSYVDGKVASITDPADRVTQLTYNIVGDLTKITDPDGTSRSFQYDHRHHMVAEIDQRGNREEILYGSAGRVEATVRKDGSVQRFGPLQTQGLFPHRATTDPENGAPATTTGIDTASYVDGNGNLTIFKLDQQGQLVSGEDATGPLPSSERDINNQVIRSTNARGDFTRFEYDDRGNLIATWDSITAGRRTLFPGATFPSGEGATHVHTDDFNRDGHLDVATANWTAGTVSVLLGNGDGTLQPQTEYTVGFRPRMTQSGDVNGDQIPDLVTANVQSDNVSVLLGNGNGTFADAVNVPVGDAPHSVSLGDINGDGRLDIVTGNRNSHDVSALLGNGNGTFGAPAAFPVGEIYVQDMALADFDGDTNLDVVVSQLGPVTILFGDGAGGFSAPNPTESTAAYVSVSDIDVDGDTDLLLGFGAFRETWIGRNDGDATFSLEKISRYGGARLVRAGDLNFDGLPDFAGIAGSFADSLLHIVLSRRDGSYAEGVDYVLSGSAENIELGDFDEDGDIDVVAANNSRSSNVVILANDGDGGFHTRTNLAPADNPDFVHLVDLDKDNDLDIVMSQEFNMRYQLSNGDGTFGDPRFAGGSWGARDIVSGDVNNDGHVDIVTANSYSGTGNLDVYLGDGAGALGDAITTEIGGLTGTNSVSLAHFNADEHLDVVIPLSRTPTSGRDNGTEVHVRLGNGDGTFGTPLILASDLGPVDVVVGMFNSDSAYDIATANLTGDNISVFLGNGNGTFGAAAHYDAGDGTRAIATDDFNNDGKADIAVSNVWEDTVSLFMGNGSGGFSEQTITAGHGADTVVARDLNQDGHVDLLLSSFNSHTVSFLIGDGSGGFPEQKEFSAARDTTGVDVGDLDNDGILDLATVNFAGHASLHFGTAGGINGPGKTLLTYDETFNQLTGVTDEMGRVTLYEIDPSNGNVLSFTKVVGEVGGADDVVTRFTYTSVGLVDTVVDARGRTTDYDYDSLGRLTKLTLASGTDAEEVHEYSYDSAGNPTGSIDPNGNETEFTYDELNRLVRIRDSEAGDLLFTYDAAGNTTSTTSEAGLETRFEFDTMHRIVKEIDSNGAVVDIRYDSEGNQIQIIDRSGFVHTSVYDGRNRIVRDLNARNGITEIDYDGDNNIIRLQDASGSETLFDHDARGRLTSETDSHGNVMRLFYDGEDNLIETRDGRGNIIGLSYDQLDRLVGETWYAPDRSIENHIESEYDAIGNLTMVSDSTSVLRFTHDDRDRLLSVETSFENSALSLLAYTYDPAGNLLSATDTIQGQPGATTSYEYDALNRVSRITQDGVGITSKRVDLTYTQDGHLASLERYADSAGQQPVASTRYMRDEFGQLATLSHSRAGGEMIAFYEYAYDASSRINSIRSVDGTSIFDYDSRGSLVSAAHSSTSLADESFEYDDNGNRISSYLHGSNYVTGEGNQLLSDGDYDYEYDEDGNVALRTERATGTVREYVHDHRNRLTKILERNSGGSAVLVVDFTYDGLDRRIAKQVTESGQTSTMLFVYDRKNVILDIRTDNAGSVSTARYLHGPFDDHVLAQEDASGAVHWLLSDHLGTVRDVVDNAGNTTGHYIFDSHGSLISGTPTTRYLFAGREFDAETGHYYNRARYYAPEIGRFLEQDPLGFVGEEVNLYRYVEGDPVSFRDPTGLFGGGGTALATAVTRARQAVENVKNGNPERNQEITRRGRREVVNVAGRTGAEILTTVLPEVKALERAANAKDRVSQVCELLKGLRGRITPFLKFGIQKYLNPTVKSAWKYYSKFKKVLGYHDKLVKTKQQVVKDLNNIDPAVDTGPGVGPDKWYGAPQ